MAAACCNPGKPSSAQPGPGRQQPAGPERSPHSCLRAIPARPVPAPGARGCAPCRRLPRIASFPRGAGEQTLPEQLRRLLPLNLSSVFAWTQDKDFFLSGIVALCVAVFPVFAVCLSCEFSYTRRGLEPRRKLFTVLLTKSSWSSGAVSASHSQTVLHYILVLPDSSPTLYAMV